MLKNKNHNIKQYRGSSPPFQGVEQGYHEWETGFSSTYQPSDESPYVSLLEQRSDQEEESGDRETDARQRKGVHIGRDSVDETELQRNQDDENRWEDDGGESGEPS